MPIARTIMLGVVASVSALNVSAAILLPELMYFKFNEAVDSTTTTNSASSPVGTVSPGLTNLALRTGGFSGSNALGGVTGSGSYVNTGWSGSALNTGDWTLALWTGPDSTGSQLSYFFGDSSGFRAFTNGVAGDTGFIMRGAGSADTLITGLSATTNNHIAFVRDSGLNVIRGYLNGVLNVTVAQPASLSFGDNFSLGGRGPGFGTSLQPDVWMDEFQLYSRALDAAGVVDAMNANFVTHAVPEPAAYILVGLALAGLAASRRSAQIAAQRRQQPAP